jgi:DNA-binding transcriptional LysR family regulator
MPMQRWLGLETRYLTALKAIDTERSFRGAAERLGYVQSAVSQQLAALERIVGARLVERARGRADVHLTPAGKVLLQHADRMFDQLRAARMDFDGLSRWQPGLLRVGAFESVATSVLPAALQALARDQPSLRLTVSEFHSDVPFFSAIAQGDLDVAFAELPLLAGPFELAELAADPIVLLVHANSELVADGVTPTLERIARLPLARPDRRGNKAIEQRLREASPTPVRWFDLQTNAAVQALVSAEVAAAITPLLAVDLDDPRTVALALDDVFPARTLALYWKRDWLSEGQLDAFVRAVRVACRRVIRRDLQRLGSKGGLASSAQSPEVGRQLGVCAA